MDFVVNLDKPKGITSHDALAITKRALCVKKAGHAGTLDPIATGVLLVCLGEATKIARHLCDMDKEYVATMKLGETTDTLDADGRVTERAQVSGVVDRARIDEALETFRGKIVQTPPMYSAIKVSGEPLYKLARKGVVIEREKRDVTISALDLEWVDLPFICIRVSCSKGTYIRSLSDDIGRRLGTGAHITELRRTRVGDFHERDSARPEDLSPGLARAFYSPDDVLRNLRAVVLTPRDYRLASNGGAPRACNYGGFKPYEHIRLKTPDGTLFAIGQADGERLLVARILHLAR